MGHRALVAYRRPDARYDLRYSHWGGEELTLTSAITADQPLADGAIEADRLATGVDRERLRSAYLDPCVHEALYIVDLEYSVTAARVCWLDWADGPDRGRGAIVTVEPGKADRELRTWFRATKSTLGDLVELDALSRRVALRYLEARIRDERDGSVYTYDADR